MNLPRPRYPKLVSTGLGIRHWSRQSRLTLSDWTRPLALAFFLASVLVDCRYWWTAGAIWADVSRWLVNCGIGSILVMMSLTLWERNILGHFTVSRYHRMMFIERNMSEFLAGGTALLSAFIDAYVRAKMPASGGVPWGVFFSLLTAVLIAVSSSENCGSGLDDLQIDANRTFSNNRDRLRLVKDPAVEGQAIIGRIG